MFKFFKKCAIGIAVSALFTACGGGGDSGPHYWGEWRQSNGTMDGRFIRIVEYYPSLAACYASSYKTSPPPQHDWWYSCVSQTSTPIGG